VVDITDFQLLMDFKQNKVPSNIVKVFFFFSRHLLLTNSLNIVKAFKN
jgi:hypothetical protein